MNHLGDFLILIGSQNEFKVGRRAPQVHAGFAFDPTAPWGIMH